ncbi:hypothetical protein VNO77_06037 [Canavalia gladiata]|uniref:Uncharacterized protein n=1 Tax=Canavalia gladiata TaxID=3824 RepID=A0AAN9N4M5_CANGL
MSLIQRRAKLADINYTLFSKFSSRNWDLLELALWKRCHGKASNIVRQQLPDIHVIQFVVTCVRNWQRKLKNLKPDVSQCSVLDMQALK